MWLRRRYTFFFSVLSPFTWNDEHGIIRLANEMSSRNISLPTNHLFPQVTVLFSSRDLNLAIHNEPASRMWGRLLLSTAPEMTLLILQVSTFYSPLLAVLEVILGSTFHPVICKKGV